MCVFVLYFLKDSIFLLSTLYLHEFSFISSLELKNGMEVIERNGTGFLVSRYRAMATVAKVPDGDYCICKVCALDVA